MTQKKSSHSIEGKVIVFEGKVIVVEGKVIVAPLKPRNRGGKTGV